MGGLRAIQRAGAVDGGLEPRIVKSYYPQSVSRTLRERRAWVTRKLADTSTVTSLAFAAPPRSSHSRGSTARWTSHDAQRIPRASAISSQRFQSPPLRGPGSPAISRGWGGLGRKEVGEGPRDAQDEEGRVSVARW